MKTITLIRSYDDEDGQVPDKFIHVLESFDKEYQEGDIFRCFEVIRKDNKNTCVRFLKKPTGVDIGAAFDLCAGSFPASLAVNWHEARQDFIAAVEML